MIIEAITETETERVLRAEVAALKAERDALAEKLRRERLGLYDARAYRQAVLAVPAALKAERDEALSLLRVAGPWLAADGQDWNKRRKALLDPAAPAALPAPTRNAPITTQRIGQLIEIVIRRHRGQEEFTRRQAGDLLVELQEAIEAEGDAALPAPTKEPTR